MTNIKLSPQLTSFLESAENQKVIDEILFTWAEMYRASMMDRFERFSEGGGDWKPLSPVTIRRRKTGKKGSRGGEKILRDYGFLFGSLSPKFEDAKSKGGRQEKGKNEITIGFSNIQHPGGGTVDFIAQKHQFGNGVPQREILVEPDEELIQDMKDIACKIMLGEE